jgi:glycosyltransferase 2 family protein
MGYALALVCLVWVFRYFHVVLFFRKMAEVDWKWVLIGMAFDVASYAVQGIRWKLLLNPFGKVRLTHSIRAVYAGLFTNLVFPLRPGEFLRSYLLSSSEQITVGRVLGSVGVERLVDLVVATASLAVVSLFVELPRRFQRAADTLGIVTLVLVTIVVLLILYLEIKLGGSTEPTVASRRLPGKVMGALVDLHSMGTAPSFYGAVLTSLFVPFCQVLGLWAMMRAYGLSLSFLAAVVVLLVINLGVSLPNAPANAGAYQFFCFVGLGVFGTDSTTATHFSFFAWVALNLPFAILGFVALVRSGLSFRSMREKISGLPKQRLNPGTQG